LGKASPARNRGARKNARKNRKSPEGAFRAIDFDNPWGSRTLNGCLCSLAFQRILCRRPPGPKPSPFNFMEIK
jgi:hypothetical protein